MSRRLFVNLGENSYDIFIEDGLIGRVGEAIRRIYAGQKAFIITDENVHRLYGKTVEDSLKNAGFVTDTLVMPAGEATKSFESLPVIYDKLLKFQLNRKGLIVTLGGGVIGDLGGFAAATFLRGVPFIQIPTSLLAQVDSSVGGKVAVDLPQGKNLVGSFYQPKAVLIDPKVLSSLSDHFFRDGMAEVIKYGCIQDAAFFEKLSGLKSRTEAMENMEEILHTCCHIKKTIVELDEKDLGERMLLNFGHTYGHAVEKYYRFERYSHGEAVAIGMAHITRISEAKGLTEKGTLQKILNILQNWGLPIQVDISDPDKILGAIMLDKKNLNDRLKAVLLKKIGESFLYDTTPGFFQSNL